RTILTGLRRDVPQMMSVIDVFLLTSLWEGLPRVIPEAMAMGVPVVAYQVDGTIEAVQPGLTGYICPPGDIDGMAASCLRLLQDANLRAQMAERGRQVAADEYDVDRMVEQSAALYEERIARLK
ncbi:MAG TPA: glycosyltransferase, partial [Anaerolineales bacterium]